MLLTSIKSPDVKKNDGDGDVDSDDEYFMKACDD